MENKPSQLKRPIVPFFTGSVSIKMITLTNETEFHRISEQIEVRQKYSYFYSLLDVWKCDETPSLVFDILLKRSLKSVDNSARHKMTKCGVDQYSKLGPLKGSFRIQRCIDKAQKLVSPLRRYLKYSGCCLHKILIKIYKMIIGF